MIFRAFYPIKPTGMVLKSILAISLHKYKFSFRYCSLKVRFLAEFDVRCWVMTGTDMSFVNSLIRTYVVRSNSWTRNLNGLSFNWTISNAASSWWLVFDYVQLINGKLLKLSSSTILTDLKKVYASTFPFKVRITFMTHIYVKLTHAFRCFKYFN